MLEYSVQYAECVCLLIRQMFSAFSALCFWDWNVLLISFLYSPPSGHTLEQIAYNIYFRRVKIYLCNRLEILNKMYKM